jgi:hypothetical protein
MMGFKFRMFHAGSTSLGERGKGGRGERILLWRKNGGRKGYPFFLLKNPEKVL